MVKLYEMFSPIGGPNTMDEPEVDWADDLKFFIDNDDELLQNELFPAIKKHKKYHGHPDAYKLYVKPVQRCCDAYCDKFDIDDRENKFAPEVLLDLAKVIADEQHKHIEKGHYK
jgi:hypothetical protein